MTEIDERRVAELATKPAEVLRSQAEPVDLDKARCVVEVLALMRPRVDDSGKRQADEI